MKSILHGHPMFAVQCHCLQNGIGSPFGVQISDDVSINFKGAVYDLTRPANQGFVP
jgi:hypothetical protein